MGDELARRRATIVVLEMDRFAGRIRDHVSTMPRLRPRLKRLLDDLLAGPLPEIAVTYPSAWGIPASFAGLHDAVINAWLELNPGHLYWLRKAWSRDHAEDMFQLLPDRFEYTQFFGFDNSLFYAVAHIALALAAQDAGLPTLLPKALITNEFYELDGSKFSTSKGHVLWGRDVLHHVTVDEFRLFMCWSNPETQSSNFTLPHLCAATERNLRAPLAVILDALDRWWSPKASAPPTPSPIVKSRCDALRSRFENGYGLDNPSLRQAGQALVLGLAHAAGLAAKCNDAPTRPNIDDLAFLFRQLAICAVPMMPTTSLEWLRRLGMDCDEVAWNMPTERLGV